MISGVPGRMGWTGERWDRAPGPAKSGALERDAVDIDAVSVVGDASPYVDLLRTALDSPVAPVVTKP